MQDAMSGQIISRWRDNYPQNQGWVFSTMNHRAPANALSDFTLSQTFLSDFANFSEEITAPSIVASTIDVEDTKMPKPKKRKQEQPKDKPKRPLSAYNLFFQHQRGAILKETPERSEGKPRRSHGKIGFAALARRIGANWKAIEPELKVHFGRLAANDKERYLNEMLVWKKKQETLKRETELARKAYFEPIDSLTRPKSATGDGMQGRNMSLYSVTDMLGMAPLPMFSDQKLLRAPSPVPIVSLESHYSSSQPYQQPYQQSYQQPYQQPHQQPRQQPCQHPYQQQQQQPQQQQQQQQQPQQQQPQQQQPQQQQPQQQQLPQTFSFVYQPPPLSNLAQELDDDCKNLLKNIFRC